MNLKQQINLYQGSVRRENPAFGAVMMAVVLVVFSAAIGTAWFFADTHARDLDKALQAMQVREAAAALRLEELTRTLARHGEDDSQSNTLREALDALTRRERLLASIDGPGLGNTNGFSASLRALAEHNLDGLWLTRILVSGPDSHTTLEGRAQTPSLVPAYLLGLASEGALNGQRFDQFEIDTDAQSTDTAVNFSMTSAPAERFALSSVAP